ncbi:MAG: DUF3891 family protein [Acidobacteria bacterium]|nr:DUF3891 family protein [Acidobacteriota bacterium]
MIIRPRSGKLLLVTQPDHAHLAAEILSLWRADDLPRHPRRPELIFAVREHDNGWREPDAAPRVRPGGGAPMPFFEAPLELRTEIWYRGVDRFSQEHPWASLLILEHALRLHRGERQDPDWQEFFSTLEERRRVLLEAAVETLGGSGAELSEDISRDYRFLELADLLSLAVCSGWQGEYECAGYEIEAQEDRLLLSPFPLAGTTRFRLRCREIDDRSYRDAVDLGVSLASARWQDREIRLEPSS